MTEKDIYEDMDLKRLLIQIDLMFNTFLRECFGKFNTKDYSDFFRNFMEPDINEPEIWEKNNFTMLVINLCINKEFEEKKKKKVNKKGGKKTKGEKEKEEDQEKQEKGKEDK